MKLFFQYCSFGFCNCYILGSEPAQQAAAQQATSSPSVSQAVASPSVLQAAAQQTAIIVDPGSMDNTILEIIENNNFYLRAVLITHDHLAHVSGLRTLKRIYDVEVFAVNQTIMEHKTTIVKDGDKIKIDNFFAEVISIPGHSSDSVVYRIDNMLFTGDVLTAGLVGGTASAYGTTTQMNKLRSRLLSLPGDYVVLPGHGPPSTLEAERRFNTDILQYDLNRSRKPAFRLDL